MSLAQKVIAHLRAHGPCTAWQIALAVGESSRRVQHALAGLVKLDRVERMDRPGERLPHHKRGRSPHLWKLVVPVLATEPTAPLHAAP